MRNRIFAASAAMPALLCAAPVLAQSSAPDNAGASGTIPGTPPAPTSEAEPAPTTDGVGDIVVTARRREESLQSVPVAITAVSGQDLETRGVRSVDDLQRAVPGLNVTGQRRDEANFYIRGQGPGVINSGQRNFTSVATYFAEVPTTIGGPGIFFDLASVQVLKGPQGTLFGRNTTGGAVLFEPVAPVDSFEGYVTARAGNYDYREVEAVLNVPVIDGKVALRLAATAAKRDGFTRSVLSGQKLDGRDYQGYRASLLLTPTDGLRSLTIYDRRDKDQSGTSAVLRQLNPAVATSAALRTFFATQQALGPRRTQIATPLYDEQVSWGVTNKTTWELSDMLTLKNIVAYRRYRANVGNDYDGTPFVTISQLNAQGGRKWQTGQNQFTEEFQIQGQVSAASLNYILGYYHELSKPGFEQEVPQLSFGTLALRRNSNRDVSDALFAHAEIDLTQALQLSGGFRYTWDKRDAGLSVFNTAGACTQRVPAGTGPLVCPFTATGKFKSPTYDATLQYKLGAEILAYVSYRRGYKSGGFNLPSPVQQFTAYDPEKVDDFEIGLKADWDIGVPLRTNLAAFIDKYKDIQISQPITVPGVGLTSLVQNVGKATNKGFEFEGTIVPVRPLSISGYLSYLDAHSDVTVPGTAAIKGRQTAFQPRWKWGVSGRLAVPVAEQLGQVALAADFAYQGKATTNETNPALIGSYPGYGLLNARVELNEIGGSSVDLALFATNLTNKTYILGGFPLASALGYETAFYGEPRMYGVSARVRFGAR
ncbi:TonB-dependent receptor [Sphingomonas jatrophae]|uniref:Iron complex outermembrane recepter protein n=1 Tax=Sphingomonas jatrophae TaxID=1166337 RepID=A0A1I6M182_9SPHN|nr:TonB-dependent receptor [Sphingomonas jatrophae]SFS09423.1 iron complex outermembrane recepter protein [Sphingomonas jatrophae]